MNQIGLFGQSAPEVVPIEPSAAQRALAASLPNRWRLGTSSWSFEGWSGRLWRGKPSASTLSRHGLRAYSHHPLMRAVGVDRTFYKPEPAAIFADWRAQVPDDFRFLVKAHDHLTLARFPRHPRHGELAGQENPRFLDVAYARDVVIGPAVEGLGHTLGTLLFQFPPIHPNLVGGRAALSVSDAVTLGAVLVSARNGRGTLETLEGNPFKGELTSHQLEKGIHSVVIRVSDGPMQPYTFAELSRKSRAQPSRCATATTRR